MKIQPISQRVVSPRQFPARARKGDSGGRVHLGAGFVGEYTGGTGCKEPDIWEVRVTVVGREGQEGKVRRGPHGGRDAVFGSSIRSQHLHKGSGR